MILPLEKPKTPLRCELCVTYWEKRDLDVTGPVRKHPPYQIVHHTVIFWSSAVAIVEECLSLAKTVVCKKEVEMADDSVCSLATVGCFVCKEIDVSGDCLTCNTKHSTSSGCEEVDRTRLLWVRKIVHLLGIIK